MTLRAQSELPPKTADAYLIWPRGGNTGDRLIADACELYLKNRGMDVWRSDGSLEEAAISSDADYLGSALSTFRGMLMFSGGGNIGIYPDNAVVRAQILKHAETWHRCLVFSQSAFQSEPALIDQRVTVWCRDSVSCGVLEQAGTRVELVPDMALYMDDKIEKHPGGCGTFLIRRARGRCAERVEHGIAFNCPTEDLTYCDPLERIVATLAPYDTVVSDRLHGGLIALMMRKKTMLLPVAYHKIRSFYDTWLSACRGVAFVDNVDDLHSQMVVMESPHCDLRSLLCRYADPALNRFLMQR